MKDLSEEAIKLDNLINALEALRGWCSHEPINVFGWYWECRCHKIKEIRVPYQYREELKKLFKQPKENKILNTQTVFGIKVFEVSDD